MFLKFLLICVLTGIADGLMCYQCSDTSSNTGSNQCQTYVRTMNYYKNKFLETGSAKKYVKNCTEFGDLFDEQVYCAVTTVEGQGDYKSFIRDCSDGKNFFQADYNSLFLSVIPDNQTSCEYSAQGYAVCVTMCQTDFCNGPQSSDAGFARPHLLPVLLGVMLVLF